MIPPKWGAIAAGVAAFLLVCLATAAPGPGLDPDALSYVGAGESLDLRGTLRIPSSDWSVADSTEPLTHFPPGFSIAVAGPIAVGATPVQGGRWIVCLSALAGAALLFALIESAAGAAVAGLTVLIAFATPAILGTYLAVLSEPLFMVALVATLSAMLAVDRWRDEPARAARCALGVGLAAAAAVMTRYAGVALVAAAVLWPLCLRGVALRRRLVYAVIALCPGLLVGSLWVYRCVSVSSASSGSPGAVNEGVASIRPFELYAGIGRGIQAGAATLRDVLIPGTGGIVWRSVLAVLAIVALGVLFRRAAKHSIRGEPAAARTLLLAAGLTGVCYLGLVVAARVIADPGIPFDERILAPFVLLLEIAAAVALASWWHDAAPMGVQGSKPPGSLRTGRAFPPLPWEGGARGARAMIIVIVTTWTCASAARSIAMIVDARTDGLDLSEESWRTSPTLDWVRTHGQGNTIYTNWPAVLYLHAHRATHDLPESLDALTRRRFRDRLIRQHGVVVAFDRHSGEMASPDSLAALVPLTPIAKLPDGTIWGP